MDEKTTTSAVKREGSPVGTSAAKKNCHGNGGEYDMNGSLLQQTPSPVVHIRNVPPEANETDIINLGMPFGRVANVLILRGKNQAFLEFVDQLSAQSIVNFWSDPANSQIQPTIKNRHVYIQFSQHKELKKHNLNGTTQSVAEVMMSNNNNGNGGNGINGIDQSSTVLRVVVENVIYAVSLDTFYQIFSRFGKVTKIVTFNKNGTFQALIQFEQNYTAAAAKNALDGQQMFSSGNIFRIEFSKLTSLNVKYNNDKSRDFTNPMLPTGGSTYSFPVFGHESNLPAGNSHHQSVGLHPSFSALSSSALHCIGPVLLVSNLNAEMVTPDALFTLFGVYGDVVRVKILFNKKDNALIQMNEAQQAQIAMTYLDKTKLYGKPIKVSASRHTCVQMPKEGQPDSGLTKDYTSSPLHRFKKPGSKNYSNIYPPSSTLHLSNIPATINEEEIREAFEKSTGIKVANFKFFPKDRKMALLQLNCVEDAIIGLIKMHNYQLSDLNHLRVSFSKSPI